MSHDPVEPLLATTAHAPLSCFVGSSPVGGKKCGERAVVVAVICCVPPE